MTREGGSQRGACPMMMMDCEGSGRRSKDGVELREGDGEGQEERGDRERRGGGGGGGGGGSPMIRRFLVLASLFAATACQLPTDIASQCQPHGTDSVWSTLQGGAVSCPLSSESMSSTSVSSPDLGSSSIILLPSPNETTRDAWLNATVSPNVSCQVGSVTSPGSILTSVDAAGGTRFAALCDLPDAPSGGLATFDVSVSGGGGGSGSVLYYSMRSVTPSSAGGGGGALITVNGVFLNGTGEGGEAHGGGCGCKWVVQRGDVTAPGGGDLASFSARSVKEGEGWSNVTVTSRSESCNGTVVICRVPPLPPGLTGAAVVSVSPNPERLPYSASMAFLLAEPFTAYATSARSPLQGGYNVTITGVDFTQTESAAFCRFSSSAGGSPAPSITPATWGVDTSASSNTSTASLECSVPARPLGLHHIDVSLNGGADYTQGSVDLTYYNAPSLVSLQPSEASHRGGMTVTVFGVGFLADTTRHNASCLVSIPSRSFASVSRGVYLSPGEMLCIIPSIDISWVPGYTTLSALLSVSFNTETASLSGGIYSPTLPLSFYQGPTIASLTPTLACGGASSQTVTVSGSTFPTDLNSVTCSFSQASSASTAAPISVDPSGNSVVCPLPPLASPASPQVEVCIASSETGECSNKAVVNLYETLALSPSTGPDLGGTHVNVTLNGDYFPNESSCSGIGCAYCRIQRVTGGVTTVTLATVVSFGGGTLVCQTPQLIEAGLVSLSISLTGSPEGDPPQPLCGVRDFLYYAPPTGITLGPSLGPSTGGSLVALVGSGLLDTTTSGGGNAVCFFGDIQVPATLGGCAGGSCSAAYCSSPPQPAGGPNSVTVGLSFNGQQITQVSVFSYYTPHSVNYTYPTACPASGGRLITVVGDNFDGGSNTTRLCRFGPVQRTRGALTFLDPPPVFANMSPPATLVNSSVITCICPSNPLIATEAMLLDVTLNAQQYTGQGAPFAMYAPIRLSALTPSSGSNLGEDVIYATGENFVSGEGLVMVFGGVAVQATLISPGLISALSPSVAIAQPVLVYVSNNGGLDRSVTMSYNYFSDGDWCPESEGTLCGSKGTCSSSKCNCQSGYSGVACTLWPAVSYVFPSLGYSEGGSVVTVNGKFLNGGCCTSPYPPYETGSAASSFSIYFGSSAQQLTGTHAGNGLITFSSPAAVVGTAVSLELTFDGGSTTVSNGAAFEIVPFPSVTSVYPTSGPRLGDTLVTIIGTNFYDSRNLRCRFSWAGSSRARRNSDTEVVCASPVAERSGLSFVGVSNNGNEYSFTEVPFSFYDTTVAFVLEPSFGTITGGTPVTVSGSAAFPSEFAPSLEAKCMFGTVEVPGTVVGSTVVCNTPSREDVGSVAFKVALDGQRFVCIVTDELSQAPCSFLYLQEFGVTSVYPTAGSTAGSLIVSVVGFGMLDEATAKCRFGTATSRLSVTSSTAATCETPSQDAQAIGQVDFAVSINGADYRSLGPASFEVYLRPLITSVSPDGAPITGGTQVSIYGEGFTTRINRLVLCRFGSLPTRSIESTATKVVCTTPAIPSPSPLPLVVTVVGIGNDLDEYSAIEWSNSTTFNYTFYAQPSITYIAPWAGFASGGDSVTIVGSGFSNGPPNPTPVCRFGQVTSPAVIIGDAEMRCASPPQSSPGSVPVLVALNGNDFTPLRKHLFAYAPSPTGALSSSPTILPTGGGTRVRATPSYSSTTSSSSTVVLFPISYWSTCLFSRADVNASSPASSAYPQDGADCASPPLGGEGEWTLSLSQNTQHKSNGAPSAPITAYNSTVATLALPSMALVPGGTPVTVSASNFGRFPQYDPWCKFGRRHVRGTLVTTGNGGKAICTAPPSPHPLDSTVPLSVSVDGGTLFSQTAINFVYHRLPVIQSASPSIGIFTGGTVVQISASNLLDSSTAKCRFGTDLFSVDATLISPSVIQCTSPPLSPGVHSLSISLSGNPSEHTISVNYTAAYPLSLSSVVPSGGPFTGGTLITLSGSGIINSTFATCLIGGPLGGETPVPATIIQDTQTAVCEVPYGNVGTFPVYLSMDGQDYRGNTGNVLFLRALLPTVDSVVPRYVPSQSSQTITVTGTNFVQTERSSCEVKQECVGCVVRSTPATVISNTTAVCTAPAISQQSASAQTGGFFAGPSDAGSESIVQGQTTDRDVKFSQDGQIYSTSSTTLTYYASHSVSSVNPRMIQTNSDAITLTVTGAGFRVGSPDTTILRLASALSTCTVVSSTRLECPFTPPSLGQALAVEVSMNSGVTFEGHSSVFVLVLAPAPPIISSAFQATYTAIDVSFGDSPATDQAMFRNSASGTSNCGSNPNSICHAIYPNLLAGVFDCGQLLDTSTTSLLGSGSGCIWKDNSTLTIYLGSEPSIALGHVIALLPNTIMRGREMSYYSDPADMPSLSSSGGGLTCPKPVISGPNTLGVCDGLVLSTALSSGAAGRDMNLTWTIDWNNTVTTLNESEASSFAALITTSYSKASQKATLTEAQIPVGTYIINLVATNWLGLNATATKTIEKSTQNLPTVSIVSQNPRTVSVWSTVELSAVASPPSCPGSSTSISLEWGVFEVDGSGNYGSNIIPSATPKALSTLSLPPFTLSPSKNYAARATATSASLSSASTVIISTSASPPIALITGGSRRRVSSTSSLVLDARSSFDPDKTPGQNLVAASSSTPLSFQWNCTVYAEPSGPRSNNCSQIEGFAILQSASSLASVPLSSGVLPLALGEASSGFTYRFTVTVSKASSSLFATAHVDVSVGAGALPAVSVTPLDRPLKVPTVGTITLRGQATLSSGQSPSSLAYSWSITSGDASIGDAGLASSSPTLKNIVIDATKLTAGVSYTFRLTATYGSLVGYGDISFSTNQPPLGGVYSVSPSTGPSLSTLFTLSASGWTDDAEDLPISYSFSTGSGQPIRISSASPTATAYLPPGENATQYLVEIVMLVSDSLSATARVVNCTGGAPGGGCAVIVTPSEAVSSSAFLTVVEGLASSGVQAKVQQLDFAGCINQMGALLAAMNMGRTASSPSVGARRSVTAIDSSESSRSRLEALRTQMSSTQSLIINAATPTPSEAETHANVLQSITVGYNELTSGTVSLLTGMVSTLTDALSDSASSSSVSDLATSLSSLHLANDAIYQRSPSPSASAARLSAVLDRIHALARKSVASHVPGQTGIDFNTASFTGKMSNTEATPFAGSYYTLSSSANISGAELSVPGIRVPTAQVPAPPSVQSPSGASFTDDASADVLFILWPNSTGLRFFDDGNATARLVTSIAEIVVFPHGRTAPVEVSGQSIALLSGPLLAINLTTQVAPRLNATTGAYRSATCVFLSSAQDAVDGEWSISGMTTGADDEGRVTCSSTHLTSFSVQDAPTDCSGQAYGTKVLDRCNVCGGTNQCVDCADLPFGNKTVDACGVCGGDSTNTTGCLGCDGRIYKPPNVAPKLDDCGVCGGNGNDRGCDGACFSGLALDQCSKCGGDGAECEFQVPLFASSSNTRAPPLNNLSIVLSFAALLYLGGAATAR